MRRSVFWLTAAGLLLFAGVQPARPNGVEARPSAQSGASGPESGVPLGATANARPTARYRFVAGRWWFLSRENRWYYWDNGRWIAYLTQRGAPAGEFEQHFANYQNYQVGQRRLRTAESGQAELATGEIAEVGEAMEVVEAGGIPRRQSERRRLGIGQAAQEQRADWFNAGSPFGTRYGYGSGFGYGGYGYNNPYGYGPRTGSGGGFSYGFGPYGSVGGQTGSQMNWMGGGPSLISPEQGSFGAPSQLEKGPVGGTVTRPSRRKLGGSAASSGRD